MTDKEYDVLQYINSHGISRTEILSSDLHLSESTVRRILDKLEQRELIVRFHGEHPLQAQNSDPRFTQDSTHRQTKRRGSRKPLPSWFPTEIL